MDIRYYMKLQNAYGTKNTREKNLAKVNYEMEKHYEDTFDVDDILLNGKPFKMMIIKDTDGNTYKKKIKSKHNDKFNLGDHIEWNGQHWLVTVLDSDDKTWNRGYMYLCTILLRWQNEKGEIVERWGYSEDFTKYATGTFGNNYITLGEYQYGITLPVDEETKFLKRGRRFPVDLKGVEPPDVYELTNRKILLSDDNYFNRGGILTLTLSFSEFNNDTDKKIVLADEQEVWICDYVEPKNYIADFKQDETKVLFAKIAGSDKLKCGYSKGYKVFFEDENKNIVTDCDFKWNIVSDFEIKNTINGNSLELLVEDEDCIGSSFLLQILDSKNAVLTEKEIFITGAY